MPGKPKTKYPTKVLRLNDLDHVKRAVLNRRECLDHVMVWNASSLHRVLQNYFEYYERSRTHLALNKDAPVSRAVEGPANGRIMELGQVGGLHHRYQRCAA